MLFLHPQKCVVLKKLTSWWWWGACSRTWIGRNQHSRPRYCWWAPSGTRRPSPRLRTTPTPAPPTRPTSPWCGPRRRPPQHLARVRKTKKDEAAPSLLGRCILVADLTTFLSLNGGGEGARRLLNKAFCTRVPLLVFYDESLLSQLLESSIRSDLRMYYHSGSWIEAITLLLCMLSLVNLKPTGPLCCYSPLKQIHVFHWITCLVQPGIACLFSFNCRFSITLFVINRLLYLSWVCVCGN